jgi:uncharacterized tellurite resistance protein B-like protein
VSILNRLFSAEPRLSDDTRTTEAVRSIAARLAGLEPQLARRLAAFAYVLGRVARADLSVDASEADEMRRRVAGLAQLGDDEAALAVELALARAEDHAASDDYLVTREYNELASRGQRAQLVECLFAVAAADGSISSAESNEALAIAQELGFSRPEALGMRSAWRDHLAELRPGARER